VSLRLCALLVIVALGDTACTSRRVVVVPRAPVAARIHTVRVTPVANLEEHKRLIQDRERITTIVSSWAVSTEGWRARLAIPIMPIYSIELLGTKGNEATYWIGKNSKPPVFPCYIFCTGWWIATSTQLDAGLVKKRLPSSVSAPFIAALLDEDSD
jgi:hypothetical protein